MTNKEFSMNDAPISFDSTHATAWAFGADHGWQACAEQYEAKLKVLQAKNEALSKDAERYRLFKDCISYTKIENDALKAENEALKTLLREVREDVEYVSALSEYAVNRIDETLKESKK
jgi:hypothetical protein